MEKFYKLTPVLKSYIWGGTILKEFKDKNLDSLSESWELSYLKDNESKIEDKNISEVFSLSSLNIKNFEEFPFLIKLIDASKKLSIQVHPDDNYAKNNENSLGKEEMWVILDAKENSYIYYGLNKELTKKELEDSLKNGTIIDNLNKVYVKKGDIFLIKPGTIHAINEGILLYELQESSNITYRLYDYDRVDKNGKKRELHIKKALDVVSLNKQELVNLKNKEIDSKYFKFKEIILMKNEKYKVLNDFEVFTLIEGNLNSEFNIFDSFIGIKNGEFIAKEETKLLVAYL